MRRSFKCGLTLVSLMVLMGLCQGCGQAGTEDVSKENEAATEALDEASDDTAAKEDNKDAENAGEDSGDKAAASDVPLKLMIENKAHYDYKEKDSYDTLMSGRYALVKLSDEAATAYPELAKALEAFNKKEEEEYLKTYDEYLTTTREWYDEIEDKESFYECSFNKNIDIVRADNAYLCVRVNENDYLGGAHGSYGSYGYNFDTATGTELKLKDVIPDIEKLRGVVKDKINEEYAEMVTLDSLDEAIPEYLTGEADQGCSWFITSEGVDIYFGIYQLGAYASGTQTVSILYDENPELFVESFRKQEDNYVQKISPWENVKADLNGDGAADELVIEPETDDYEWANSLNVKVNGTDNKVDAYGYDTTPYLVHVDGNTYIYVKMLLENDYKTTFALKVSGDKVEKIDEYAGAFTDKLPISDYQSEWTSDWEAAITSPTDLYIGNMVQIFSTHTGVAKAYIDSDGKLVKPEDYYYALQYDTEYRISNKKELTATEIDKDSLEAVNENVTVPAGTKFAVYGTKGEDIVDLIDSEGKVYRFNIKSDDWPQTIDGVDIEELFDGIMFAG